MCVGAHACIYVSARAFLCMPVCVHMCAKVLVVELHSKLEIKLSALKTIVRVTMHMFCISCSCPSESFHRSHRSLGAFKYHRYNTILQVKPIKCNINNFLIHKHPIDEWFCGVTCRKNIFQITANSYYSAFR